MLNRLTSSVIEVDGCHRLVASEEGVFSDMIEENSLSTEMKNKSPNPPRTEDDVSLSKFEEEILNLLMGHELYGLQIIRAFDEASGGKRKISIGSLYPTLSRLEEKGLVTSRMVDRPSDDKGGARRKYFRITRRGAAVLLDAEDFRKKLGDWQPAL